MIEARGAPRDQGLDQGGPFAEAVCASVARERRRLGPRGWPLARLRVHRDAGRKLARFLPQQHERLQGIAAAARVSLAALELIEALQRVEVEAAACGAILEARFDGEAELCVRLSVPDAGGFPSVELTTPSWAGCLAGVNAEGVGVVCARDLDPGVPPLRLLAQDLLFRTRSAATALEHLRRRASYLGSSGTLLLADEAALPWRVEIRAGSVEVREPAAHPLDRPSVRIDAAGRTLVWRDPDGSEHKV